MTAQALDPDDGPLSKISSVRIWSDAQAGAPTGDATRHLCAAAYLDRPFRKQTIEELVEQKYRVPAPMPGIDGSRVLAACLRARRAAVVQGLAIMGIGLAGLILTTGTFFFVFILLSALRLTTAFSEIVARWAESKSESILWRSFAWSIRIYNKCLVWGGTVSLLLILLFLTAASAGLGVLAAGWVLAWNLLCILALIAVGAIYRYHRRGQMDVRSAAPSRPDDLYPALRPVFDRLSSRIGESETVYGGEVAFIGAGKRVIDEEWSFSVELAPRQRGGAMPGLTSADMHRLVAARLASLGGGRLYPGDALHQVTVRDRVFRFGMRPQRAEEWLGSLSVRDPRDGGAVLHPELVDLMDLASNERLRHYIEVRTDVWEHQVVASVFLRIYLQGDLLHIEGLPFVLLPVRKDFQKVDETLPRDFLVDGALSVVGAVTDLPKDVTSAMFEPAAWLVSAVKTWYTDRWYRHMLRVGYAVQHGSRFSPRELGAEQDFTQRFQELDVRRFIESVSRRAQSAVLEILREYGYDTSEFENIVQNFNFVTGTQINGAVSGSQTFNTTLPR